MQVAVSSIFSDATKYLTIVIPAYNEEKRLPSTLDETLGCAFDDWLTIVGVANLFLTSLLQMASTAFM